MLQVTHRRVTSGSRRGGSGVCLYQAHHHVHWADFDRVDAVNKLLDLVKGGPVGGVMSTTAADQLWVILGYSSA